jgi:membrane-associated phospholipid phosphatase
VTEFYCTNEKLTPKRAEIIMESFPSGQAGLAAYLTVFLIFYFQKRIKTKFLLLTPLIQGVLLIWMSVVCASRVYDNYHHATDVIFGVFMGALCAVFTVSLR